MEIEHPRVLVWFSCGAASAVAAKLAVREYGDRTVIAYCDTGSEHPDNERFLSDVEGWIDREITILKNHRYSEDELQRLKEQAGFGNCWAVEVFPPDESIVNVANMRHLWILREEPEYGWLRPEDSPDV